MIFFLGRGSRPTGWEPLIQTNSCPVLLHCSWVYLSVSVCLPVICLYCLFSKQWLRMRWSIFLSGRVGERTSLLSPLNIMAVTAGTRLAPFPGTAWFTTWKGKPKSPSNENIKVSARHVRNLLPLTPINSYKTLVLSCLRAGTQTLDFIKAQLSFLLH